ncbi:conserved Plasmodium protein, unknown function [Plasmodium relictum]|uniref:Uncharacterized protein n=1 Tax=Plasmodium relictum TaxID=85471 RepID=A0A1J1HB60_PLARL|nr:conserved Plasmodium protein, unknown function [Plasmodium relictum]CRH01729.1 conserved Plasmodium protein, unknown function [Plasmodium relictum]
MNLNKERKKKINEGNNNDKLFFKLYEYVAKINNFCIDINNEKVGSKIKCVSKNRKFNYKNEAANAQLEISDNIDKTNINILMKNKKKQLNKIIYENESYNFIGNESDDGNESFDEDEKSSHSFLDNESYNENENEDENENENVSESPIFINSQLKKMQEKKCNYKHMEECACNATEQCSTHINNNIKDNNSNYDIHNSQILKNKNNKIYEENNLNENEKKRKENSSDKNIGIYKEIENYYFIYKLNRKIEEHKSVNEIKILKKERTLILSEIIKKIEKILSYYKEIKNELHMLIKNKQFIYKTFYFIFLHYYYDYTEVKLMKMNKNKIERYLKYYTNTENFEIILNNIEKNEYAYFIDIYSNSINNDKNDSLDKIYNKKSEIKKNDEDEYEEEVIDDQDDESETEEDETENEKYDDMENEEIFESNEEKLEGKDNEDISSTDIEVPIYFDKVSDENEKIKEKKKKRCSKYEIFGNNIPTNTYFLDYFTKQICKNRQINYTNNINNKNLKKELYQHLLRKKKKNKTKTKKLYRKNEIYYMLQFSEKAINFFNKNCSYFNSKSKVTKYQSIIKRILNYIKKLFRDVLNNTDLNILNNKDNKNRLYTSIYEIKNSSYNKKFKNEYWTDNNINKYFSASNNDINVNCKANTLIYKNKNVINENDIDISSNQIFKIENTINENNNEAHNNLHTSNIYDSNNINKNIINEYNPFRDNKTNENINNFSSINNLIKDKSLMLTNDENEINKIYNNLNIIYFNKYVDEFEYYKKYKIKCKCMRDILNFIYKKSLIDENNIYIDEYNSIESFYVSTRIKILNNNILRNFDYFSNKDICKYIKNVCLLAIYISKLESDLFFYIFNNNLNSSIDIILNNIGVSVYDNINENIYELNNIQVIRKIIQIIYVDVIETYNDNSYRIICDYLRKICKALKERLLYIIEMYISYYTKNISKKIPYICFQPIKKKFINIINDFLYEEYSCIHNNEKKTKENKKDVHHMNTQKINDLTCSHNSVYYNENPLGKEKRYDHIEDDKHTENNNKNINIDNNACNIDYSSDSIESENNHKEHECNINLLNEKNVYKPFSFYDFQFNKDTKFCLRGIDMNIIGSIIILKTINFIIEEETYIDLFKECLDNTFNSLYYMYKQHIKEYNDIFNGSLFLLKNLSFLLYLFYKITKDKDFLNLYLDKELTQNLLFQEKGKRNYNDKISIENEKSILYFIKKVYNVSSNSDIQNKILTLFNESIYNFTITTISNVCFPLIKILSSEYKENILEKEENIKKVVHNFINEKKNKEENEDYNYMKVNFSFLNEINFKMLDKYAEKIIYENRETLNSKNKEAIKNSLQLFRQKIYFLFPKIYFYVKLFICSNTDQYNENNFFYYLFNYIIGILKYKIIYLLSEVYIILRCKYADDVRNIFEENYINDLYLFLNSNEQYICVFSDIHQYYDLNKNYNFLCE